MSLVLVNEEDGLEQTVDLASIFNVRHPTHRVSPIAVHARGAAESLRSGACVCVCVCGLCLPLY
jgi:hypothetical protein